MVLQAVVRDLQSLLSLPLTPFTYQVVARAAEGNARSSASSTVMRLDVVTCLRVERWVPRPDELTCDLKESRCADSGKLERGRNTVSNVASILFPASCFVNCLKHAITQACAVCSPFAGVLSDIAMLRQLIHDARE